MTMTNPWIRESFGRICAHLWETLPPPRWSHRLTDVNWFEFREGLKERLHLPDRGARGFEMDHLATTDTGLEYRVWKD